MENIFIYNTIEYLYFLFVKWVVLKPMVKLSYIINGKTLPPVKWYQRGFGPRFKWRGLTSIAYKLSKHVMFDLDPRKK